MHAYGVKRRTVAAHLDRYVQSGNPLPVERLRAESQLSSAMQERVLATFDKLGADFLRPVFDTLNETVPYEELRLMRVIYRLQILARRAIAPKLLDPATPLAERVQGVP